MITKILIGLAAIIVLFFIVVALRPADFRVERSATIAAPAMALFDQVNDQRRFNSGVGAVCSWDGNKDIGAGSATIIESKPGELVRLRMDWKRPMEGVATVDFTFKPEGDKTVMTWAMYGRNGLMGKLVSLFVDCDKMCGPQFEQGLADVARVVAAVSAVK
jgi:hypothetical protein